MINVCTDNRFEGKRTPKDIMWDIADNNAEYLTYDYDCVYKYTRSPTSRDGVSLWSYNSDWTGQELGSIPRHHSIEGDLKGKHLFKMTKFSDRDEVKQMQEDEYGEKI